MRLQAPAFPHRALRTLATAGLALMGPLLAQAAVTALPNGSSLTGGYNNFSTVALGGYTSLSGSIGPVGFTASPSDGSTQPQLWRITPSDFGPGFCWCDNLLFTNATQGLDLSFDTPLLPLQPAVPPPTTLPSKVLPA